MIAGVVLLAGPGESTNIVYHALAREVGVKRVVLEEPVARRQLLRRRRQKLGTTTVIGQVLFKLTVERALRRRCARRIAEIKREFGLDDRPIPSAALSHVPSVNAPETIEHLRALAPSVVVVNGTRIIAQRVLEAVSAPFINMHAGITPLYRGVHGGYWALANDDREHCGVTVHLVDAGIDTGTVLGQARIFPTERDTFVTYPLLQLAAGLPILVDAVRAAQASRVEARDGAVGKSRLWSHPTITQYVRGLLRNGTC